MADKLRIDKWLWHARFFKTRSLAARVVADGAVRVNGERVAKTSFALTPGDTLTFPQAKQIRVVEVVALGTRRGPAEEAQALYSDHTPPVAASVTPRVGARPTGRDRRKIDAVRNTAK